ncbi:MAG: trypsin-like serine protease, partial [Erysipelotrichia bacterium]|nr:trypsin-like serine protease [Erysipelotrichia bacterium]
MSEQNNQNQVNQNVTPETIDVQFSEVNTAPTQPAAGNAVPPAGGTVPPVYNQTSAPIPPKAEKKNHPVLTVVLSAIVSIGCGFGGGYLAGSNSSSKTTVVYREAAAETQTADNGSSVSSAKNEVTIQEIAAKASPSVVEIVTEVKQTTYGIFGGSYTSEAAGSGVIISSDGYIMTNNHVIENALTIKVTGNDGTEYDARLIGADSKSDIAIIKVDAENLPAAVIGDSSTIQVGDTAVVIGNPLGTLGGTVTDGIISATDRSTKCHCFHRLRIWRRL